MIHWWTDLTLWFDSRRISKVARAALATLSLSLLAAALDWSWAQRCRVGSLCFSSAYTHLKMIGWWGKREKRENDKNFMKASQKNLRWAKTLPFTHSPLTQQIQPPSHPKDSVNRKSFRSTLQHLSSHQQQRGLSSSSRLEHPSSSLSLGFTSSSAFYFYYLLTRLLFIDQQHVCCQWSLQLR